MVLVCFKEQTLKQSIIFPQNETFLTSKELLIY